MEYKVAEIRKLEIQIPCMGLDKEHFIELLKTIEEFINEEPDVSFHSCWPKISFSYQGDFIDSRFERDTEILITIAKKFHEKLDKILELERLMPFVGKI